MQPELSRKSGDQPLPRKRDTGNCLPENVSDVLFDGFALLSPIVNLPPIEYQVIVRVDEQLLCGDTVLRSSVSAEPIATEDKDTFPYQAVFLSNPKPSFVPWNHILLDHI